MLQCLLSSDTSDNAASAPNGTAQQSSAILGRGSAVHGKAGNLAPHLTSGLPLPAAASLQHQAEAVVLAAEGRILSPTTAVAGLTCSPYVTCGVTSSGRVSARAPTATPACSCGLPTDTQQCRPHLYCFPCSVPAGARLSRRRSGSTSASSRCVGGPARCPQSASALHATRTGPAASTSSHRWTPQKVRGAVHLLFVTTLCMPERSEFAAKGRRLQAMSNLWPVAAGTMTPALVVICSALSTARGLNCQLTILCWSPTYHQLVQFQFPSFFRLGVGRPLAGGDGSPHGPGGVDVRPRLWGNGLAAPAGERSWTHNQGP